MTLSIKDKTTTKTSTSTTTATTAPIVLDTATAEVKTAPHQSRKVRGRGAIKASITEENVPYSAMRSISELDAYVEDSSVQEIIPVEGI